MSLHGTGSPRSRAVAHLRQLMAVATLAGAEAACKKDPPLEQPEPPEPLDASKAAVEEADVGSTAANETPIVDASLVAPSTPDAAVLAGPTEAKKRADAGSKHIGPPNHGYTVVDPLPRPTRLPDGGIVNCTVPYLYDAEGHKHYKPECM